MLDGFGERCWTWITGGGLALERERRKAESKAEMLASWEGLERALPQWVGCRKLVWMSIRRRQVVESRAIGAGMVGEVSVDGLDRGNGLWKAVMDT